MMNIVKIIFSFAVDHFLGRKKESVSYPQIIWLAYEHAKRLFSSVALAAVGAVFAITGFFVALFNLLGQLDRQGAIVTGAVASGGLGLVLIGLGMMMFAAKKQDVAQKMLRQIGQPNAEQETTQGEQAAMGHGHPLEQALSVLVLDFVKSREESREARRLRAEARAAARAQDFSSSSASTDSTISSAPASAPEFETGRHTLHSFI